MTRRDASNDLEATIDLEREAASGSPGHAHGGNVRPFGTSPSSSAMGESISVVSAGGPGVELIRGDHGSPQEELLQLLQLRLRAAASVLLVGFLLYFIQGMVLAKESVNRVADESLESWIFGSELTVIGALVTCIGLLSWRRDWSLACLRCFEVAIFGTVLVFFACIQYFTTTASVRAEDAVSLVTTVKDNVVFMYSIMIIYGLFIPNPLWRDALVVGLIVLVASLVQFMVRYTTVEHEAFLQEAATPAQISGNVILLILGAVLAVYGSWIINSLRREVRVAKQFGQYQLRELIGSGGMGEVYLAEHQLLKRPCAIKLIRPTRAGDPAALKRFEREVRSAARLTHWNTIEIYDYGRTEDGTFYYVMEHLKGLSLGDLVVQHGPLPPGRVVHLLAQACEALAEAHAKGLVHRDIKPANLFASFKGGKHDVTKLLDFGLVKDVSMGPATHDPSMTASRDNTLAGSPMYMSPEQAMGQKIDPRSDIHALGAVAYYLTTARHPFRGQTPMQVLVAVARDPVESPRTIDPLIPEDLVRVILCCMAKDPANRFRTALQLREALLACHCAESWDFEAARAWWEGRAASRRGENAEVEIEGSSAQVEDAPAA